MLRHACKLPLRTAARGPSRPCLRQAELSAPSLPSATHQRTRCLATTAAQKIPLTYPPPRRAASANDDATEDPVEEDPEGEAEYEDFGAYSILLPPEPFVFGTDHLRPWLPVPAHIARPPYALRADGMPESDLYHSGGASSGGARGNAEASGKIKLGGETERRVRGAARLARRTREFAGTRVKVGATTAEIDAAVHDFIVENGAYPSPLGYQGFPRSCCTSINNIIAHGIPDDRPLEDGDIINIDVTVFLNGYHGDTSQTFLVGNGVDAPGRDLVRVTNEALERAIAACGPGKPFRGIGKAIHELLRDKHYSVSAQFTGHGINSVFHCAPWIHHALNDEPGVMEPGHCFTIEPAIIQGLNPRGWIFPDGWTASTENCARSAQAEHMVLITETGVDVLTL